MITGPGANLLFVSGNYASTVFQIDGGVTASISGLNIAEGYSSNLHTNGGGLVNRGTVTLTDCSFSGNYASGSGGGLVNYGGTATLTACTISGNSAVNSGGLVSGGTTTLTDCTISKNDAGGVGGGLLNYNGTATLTDCTVSGNSVSGIISEGGGLANLSGCTATLTNSTVSGNSAGQAGGGLEVLGLGTATLTNTIVAGNTTLPNGGGSPSDIAGKGVFSGSYNLIGTGGSGGLSNGVNHNQVGVANPLLGTLGDYGGPTRTIPLLPGSPAIGQGSLADYPGTSTPITTDQRGLPLDSPTPDIGAFQTNHLVVNTTVDGTGSPSGDLSLRQAVNLANALGGTEAITFDPKVFATPQTITLDGPPLELKSGTETITGPAAGVTVSGGGSTRVFMIDSGVTASISGLTITGGNSGSYFSGGGLYNAGTTTLIDCTVSGNFAGVHGGGLDNEGAATLTLTDCTLSGNSAGGGGGLYNAGTATLTNSTVSGNSAKYVGGGLNNVLGTATLTNCTVSGNSATSGGGLDNFRGTATLTNTIVAGNSKSDILGSYSGSNNLIGGNPLLAPLGDYGGPTQTMALLPGSPAIGSGDSSLAPATDQRGLPRFGPTDIGAYEDQFKVVNNNDSGTGSLRQAIANANSTAGADTIVFLPVVAGIITLTSGQLELKNTSGDPTQTIAIDGPGANLLFISSHYASRVFQIDGGVTASISGLTITGGNLASSGAVYNLGPASLTLTDCIVSGNLGGGLRNGSTTTLTDCTVSDNSGGGLVNTGSATLTLTDCTVSDNSATSGGGLFNTSTATLSLTDCTVSGNSATGNNGTGGALYDRGGTTTLTNCTVSGNSAAFRGGGLYEMFSHSPVTLTLTNSTVSGNSAGSLGGGLYNLGVLTLTNSTVSGNSATSGYGIGGGLDNIGSSARATLTNCTISGNSAKYGGGLAAQARTVTLTNSTVSGNSASQAGGGLDNDGPATLTNTIVAGNTTLPNGGGSPSDIAGKGVFSGSYNLIGTGGSGGLSNGVNHNQVGVASPLLGTLGNYGGPTQTIPLLPGSPAIGTGSPALAVDPSTGQALTADQRGYTPSSMADIGAFQDQGFILTPVTTSTPQTAVVGMAFANPLAVAVTAKNISQFTNPVAGGLVSFSASATGASAVLSSSSPVIIGANGQASITATANTVAGNYTVTALASGVTTPASFSLTNAPGQASQLYLTRP
jgi:parallel beta-helix repeat protein